MSAIQKWKVKHGYFIGAKGKKDKALNTEVRKVYRAWRSIKTRCFNVRARSYKDYGARGITMCHQWQNDFAIFLRDVGYAPSEKYSIGRIDNNGNYEPKNCEWQTARQQQQNTRQTVFVTIGKETKCLASWARHIGITPESLTYRITKGFPVERLLAPARKKRA